jgi:hypothetical protein
MVWPLKISFQGHLTTQLLKQRCTLYFNEIRLGRRIDKELQYEKVCSRIMCIPPLYFRNCIWRDTFFCLVWELCGVIDMKYDHACIDGDFAVGMVQKAAFFRWFLGSATGRIFG